MNDDQIDVTNNEAARRWEARIGDDLAGYAEYRQAGDRVTFTHTMVFAQFEGRGIGSGLARAALDDAVSRGLRVTPRCPFIRAYIERHPDYALRVDDARTNPPAA